MPHDPESLKIANESGFPLQIAVQRQVDETSGIHGWNVRYSEHSWAERPDGQSGFIDLVLQDKYKTTFLIVECKRVRHATWLFLPSDGTPKPRRHAKAWVTLFQAGGFSQYGWMDITADPRCQEAHFCALRGQSANDRITLLERVGAELVSSTEALAAEERDYRPDSSQSLKTYLNAIVTTADLKVAKFDPKKISLSEGTLQDAEFESVPYVRLRKQLSARATLFSPTDYRNAVDISASKEHTVLVVRADALPGLLAQLEVDDASFHRFSGG